MVHTDKHALLFRGLLGDLHTRASMEGLLERGLRASASTCYGRPEKIGAPLCSSRKTRPTLWVNSLVQWLDKVGQGLWRHGASDSPERILDLCNRLQMPLLDDSPSALSEAGLHSVLDLLRLSDVNTPEWNPEVFEDCAFLGPLQRTPVPSPIVSILLPGQCWSTENSFFPRSDGFVLEYLGQADDKACIRVWQADAPINVLSAQSYVTLPPHSFSRGGGTQHCYSFAELWSDPFPLKVILGGDLRRHGSICRQVISAHSFPPPSLPTVSHSAHPWLSSWVCENAQELRGCDMFTDGSCIAHPSFQAQLFEDSSPTSSGSVVMIDRNSGNHYGFMLHITQGEDAGLTSATSMELFSAAVACRIRKILYQTIPNGEPIHLFCDSQSTVNRVQNIGPHTLRHLIHKQQGALHFSLSRTSCRNLQTVHFMHTQSSGKGKATLRVHSEGTWKCLSTRSRFSHLCLTGISRLYAIHYSGRSTS
jgi:hypothetical protein